MIDGYKSPPKRSYVAREREIQREIRRWLAVKGYTSVHVPNGSHLSGDRAARARQMAALKNDGLMPGFPDLIVFDGRGRVGFIEVKGPSGSPSHNQVAVKQWMERDGYKYAVCRNLDEAKAAVSGWGWL